MTELEPVAQQWAVFENGLQKTSWTPAGYGDEAGWAEVSKRYEFFSVEYRPLVTLSSAQSAIAERDARIAELEAKLAEYRDHALPYWEARAEAAEALLKEAEKVLEPFASGRHEVRNTHLLDWLPEGYDHCRLGSKDWAQAYLNSAKDYIKAFESAARSLASKIGGGE